MISKHSASTVCFLLFCLTTGAKKDYYDIIDVPQSATERQIKKAFHKLARKYHPDKNNSPDAEVIFREIVEAYEVLSNDLKRRSYDEHGHKAFNEDPKDKATATFYSNIFQFSFEELFRNLGLEDDLFMDSPEDVWSFQLGDVDEGDQGGRFFDRDFFSFLGDDFNENSFDRSEDGFQDPEPRFCWLKTLSDGSTTRVCEED